MQGKPYADVRIFYRDGSNELKPTRKSLTISPEIWSEFLQGIERLSAELAERGLLEELEEVT